jgi:SAM-dependent methyltransferase
VYKQSVKLYDAIYHFKDYGAASERLHEFIQRFHRGACTFLDVACGTGKHAEWLQQHYEVEGLDVSDDMLAIARERCPRLRFHCASMVAFDLGRTFDVVACLFSSIGYVKTVENFFRTVETLARHVAPGGLLIVEPYFTPDSYWVGRLTMNVVDTTDHKIVWMYLSERVDRVSRLDIHYLIGTPSGVEDFRELHEIGLFTHEEYVNAFHRSGFDLHHDPVGLFQRGLYIGRDRRPRA